MGAFQNIVPGTDTGAVAASKINNLGLDANISIRKVSEYGEISNELEFFDTNTIVYAIAEDKYYKYSGSAWAEYAIPTYKGTGFTDAIAGSVNYKNASNASAWSSPLLHIDNTNGRVGIGTASPYNPATLNIVKDGASAEVGVDSYGSSSTLIFRKANGSIATPTAVLLNDSLGSIGVRGYDGTVMGASSKAYIAIYASENWSDSAQGTYITFATTNTGGTTRSEKVIINPNGSVGIGTVSTNASAILDLTSTTGALLLPRMTTAQRDANITPTSGMAIFNVTTLTFQIYYQSGWKDIGSLTDLLNYSLLVPLTQARNTIQSTNDIVPLTLKGKLSQTANLQEWQNSIGTVLGSVSPSGLVTADSGLLTNGLTVNNSAGATGDMQVKTDTENNMLFSDASADQLFVSGTTNGVRFDKAKGLTYIGTAVEYDDLPPIPLLSQRVGGANNPSLTVFDGNIYQLTFAVNDYVFGSMELVHSYAEGATISPHVHWAANGSNTSDRYVKWELEYTIANPKSSAPFDSVFPAATIITGETIIPANTASLAHILTGLSPEISGTNIKIGAYIIYRFRRIAASSTAPSSNPFAFNVGFHVAVDTIGSRTVSSKA